MVRIIVLLVFCFPVSETDDAVRENLDLPLFETLNSYLSASDNFDMKAKFNINGEEIEKKVIKSWLTLYNRDTVPQWLVSESLQIVFYFLDGNTPLKMTNLHENGTFSVQYLGSLTDTRCKLLNCKYEIEQPVGSIHKKELVDRDGWLLMGIITSPNLPVGEGYKLVPDSEMTCSLNIN